MTKEILTDEHIRQDVLGNEVKKASANDNQTLIWVMPIIAVAILAGVLVSWILGVLIGLLIIVLAVVFVLINGVMGLCGEAGEAIDIVKKYLAQGHELDQEKLIKELGDIAWYLAETAYALDVPLEEVLSRNIQKLKARYPQGFDTERSIHRGE